MLEITTWEALCFLPFAVPIGIWVAVNDMAHMKIPNKAVMALVAVFAVVGLVALPLEAYLWRWLHLVVVLVIGFLANMIRLLGAGDAKFAAAMAPFIVLGDATKVIYLFAGLVLLTYAGHRIARAVPAIRNATPDWESWKRRKDFPMGLALGPLLIVYLALGALYGT
ncbi:prepilin peptidase CpaA [Aliiruegeria haliotis]|uniref:Prepilin peptidase CpaA n=1 Tax=Aliiruegeria haliotis TaxID=1280846 RepID=A0A2T0RVF8_9RHOB|nr:prepilin peptidase [Aliiruegeria haliotis]PRY25112.1 prepilin peptidase CpaA [Aliiruegeria haliotis]